MVGEVFLKGREGVGVGAIFSRFFIYTFRNYVTPLQNCVMHLKKNYFFCHHNFMKKGHSSLSKKEPENIP